MSAQLFSALVSLLSLFYARYLNSLPTENLSEEELKNRHQDVIFYTLFGLGTMLVSFYPLK